MAAAFLRRSPRTIFHQLAATRYMVFWCRLNTSSLSCAFNKMTEGSDRKYFMVEGKGGVRKTSCAASLTVKFANTGHPTIVVSTDPAHSLSDSFDRFTVQGVDSLLHALEINPEKTRGELREGSMKSGGRGIKDVMDGMGLGPMFDQPSARTG